MGNAKASWCGTSNWYDSHVFLFYIISFFRGIGEARKNYTKMKKEVYEHPVMQVIELELQGVIAASGGAGGQGGGWG